MRLSVVIPLLNEEANLRALHERLSQVIAGLACERRSSLSTMGAPMRRRR